MSGSKAVNEKDSTRIIIPDSFHGYHPASFGVAPEKQDDFDGILISEGLVRDRVRAMARKVVQDIKSERLIVVCILKGAFRFANEFLDQLRLFNSESLHVDFIRLNSYENMASIDIKVVFGEELIKTWGDAHVLILEDMVDTGATMHVLSGMVRKSGIQPKSFRVAVLLRKRKYASCQFLADYVGFEVPDRFLVGYGFDYNEMFRNLAHVCVLSASGMKKYQKGNDSTQQL